MSTPISPAVWVPLLVVLLGLVGWAMKRLLWDPIDQLRAAQKGYVTQPELDMQIEDLNRQMGAMRTERDEGEKRIMGTIDAAQRENLVQRNETRQDIRALVQRVDTVMQQVRH